MGVFDTWQLEFVQRGMAEVALLGIAGGLLGTWIVLRGLAFFSHAVGASAFPGLVLADGLAFSPHLGAAGSAGLVAGGVGWLSRTDRDRYDSHTALVLVGALAVGIVLASDVFHSGSNVETLLFGSALLIGPSDLALAAVAVVAVLALSAMYGPRWLAAGFDPSTARAMGLRTGRTDSLLLALVAFVALAMLTAIGALLATALLVVPAATTRLVSRRLGRWQLASVALAVTEGVAGLWASVELNAPPGAAIAVLSGAVFALVGLGRALAHIRRPRVAAAVGLLAALLVAGCGSTAGGGSGGRLKVVATTTQLGDIVREIGGDRVAVTQILRPNTDPHDYEPRPADVEATAGADLVIESGDNLDKWMDKVIDQAGGSPTVLVAGDKVPEHVSGETSGPEASKYDPHWWHDPRNAEAATTAIRDALAKALPAGSAFFARATTAYLAKLGRLDAGIAECMAAVPVADRKLVTDHDAFGYFARRYGIAVVGAVIPSQTTQAQPSAGSLADLARLIRREKVSAVFPESSINPKLAEAIARQTGASANYTLYGDTLGPAGSDGATYLGMELHNADAMVRGFTGGRRGCRIAGL
jgi:ABC-type Zn uptake system ZnuABC Zn-binding protein ZnuA/ABC-type Mn2+/Zn2+ transport system permease subunit